MIVQRYSFLHKIGENENIFVLNFAKSNNLKVLLPIFFVTKITYNGNNIIMVLRTSP